MKKIRLTYKITQIIIENKLNDLSAKASCGSAYIRLNISTKISFQINKYDENFSTKNSKSKEFANVKLPIMNSWALNY